jgi:hypothetical protein
VTGGGMSQTSAVYYLPHCPRRPSWGTSHPSKSRTQGSSSSSSTGGLPCQLSCALNKRSPRGFPLRGSARRQTNLPRMNPDKKNHKKRPLLERW